MLGNRGRVKDYANVVWRFRSKETAVSHETATETTGRMRRGAAKALEGFVSQETAVVRKRRGNVQTTRRGGVRAVVRLPRFVVGPLFGFAMFVSNCAFVPLVSWFVFLTAGMSPAQTVLPRKVASTR